MWYKFVDDEPSCTKTVFICQANSADSAKLHLQKRHSSNNDVIVETSDDLDHLLQPYELTAESFSMRRCVYVVGIGVYVFVSRAADYIKHKCITCHSMSTPK